MKEGAGIPRGEIRRAARAGVLLVVAGGVTGVLNLVFNVVVAREGGVADYGAIGPLLTVVTVVGLVATGFQYGIARRAALSTRGLAQLIGPTLRSVAPWAAGSLVVVAIFWPLYGFLKLHSLVPALLIAALAAVSVLGAAVSGLLVGFRLFKVIAGLGVGSAVLRLGLGFLVGRGSAAVVLSLAVTVVAGVATLLSGLLLLAVAARRIPTSSGAPGGTAEQGATGRTGFLGALIAGALWTTWGLPVLFARHALSAGAAGDFAATQLLVGALIWGTAPIVTAFFPTIALRQARSAFLYGECATCALALLGAGLLTLVGPLAVHRLYGAGFTGSRTLIAVLAVSATATACATFAAWAAMAGRVHVGGVLLGLTAAVGSELLWDSAGPKGAVALALGPALALAVGGTTFVAVRRRLPSVSRKVEIGPSEIPHADRPTAALTGEQ